MAERNPPAFFCPTFCGETTLGSGSTPQKELCDICLRLFSRIVFRISIRFFTLAGRSSSRISLSGWKRFLRGPSSG